MNDHQPSLFPDEKPKATPKPNNDFLHNQLVKLGDMMGDGLHHEEPWIAKEYGKVAKALMPDFYKEKRAKRIANINEAMAKLLNTIRCKKCQGKLVQTRSGSYKCICIKCGEPHKAVSSKSK